MSQVLFLTLLTHLVVVSIVAEESGQIHCRDEKGVAVDWYIGYKFPQLEKDARFQSGYAYAYATSDQLQYNQHQKQLKSRNLYSRVIDFFFKNAQRWMKRDRVSSSLMNNQSNINKGWTLSKYRIDDPESCVARTLEAAYGTQEESSSVSSIFYNDQPPADSSGKIRRSAIKAHAKGIILMDKSGESGLWLTHSVPLFPSRRGTKFQFHENSRKFGQTFMCISLDLRQNGKQVVQHLVNMQPLVYDWKISDKVRTTIPAVDVLINGKRGNTTPKLAQTITTRGGKSLNLYSKSADFKQDMYSSWIDGELGTALFVETWRQGKGTPLNSTCPEDAYHVNNIKDLKYDKSTTWSYLHDHSKWAISEEESNGIFCIGDSNRMQSQFKRGGGAVCLRCPSCWSLFSNTILDIEPCPRNNYNYGNNNNNKSVSINK